FVGWPARSGSTGRHTVEHPNRVDASAARLASAAQAPRPVPPGVGRGFPPTTRSRPADANPFRHPLRDLPMKTAAPLSRSLLAVAVSLAIITPPVFAQDASEGDDSLPTLESIIVTAQKREQQAQDVPIAISPVSGEFLDRNNITTFEQIGGYVPGLQTQVQSAN